MSAKVRYEGKEKTYLVTNNNSKLKKRMYVIFLILPLIFFSVVSYLLVTMSFSFGKPSEYVEYNEMGSIDYKVYLEENDYYETDYIDTNMNLISSLIDNIELDFNYEIHSTMDLDFAYNYEILANVEIFDQNDKLINNRETSLATGKVDSVVDKSFRIHEEVKLDYLSYDAYVTAFKKDYNLITTSQLTVTMKLTTTGDAEGYEEVINLPHELSIVMPLNEKTIEIDTTNTSLNNSIREDLNSIFGITDMTYFLLAIPSIAIAITLLIVSIYIIAKTASERDIYTKTVSKYLREYDRIIVTSKQPALNEETFANKIRVMTIEELVDAHDITKEPIIYYEVIPNEKSYFVIMSDTTLYKLTISRAYLDKKEKENRTV